MNSTPPYTIYPCGDHALTIDFGNMIDENINHYVHILFAQLKQQNIVGVKDVIPAYSSITVVYDVVTIQRAHPSTTAYNTVLKIVGGAISKTKMASRDRNIAIKIPVCYHPVFALDLAEMAVQKGISTEDIVQMHCNTTYNVFMLGFLPGFAYMGTVSEKLETARKNNPRTKVPAGSVGIAGKQTGIYPFESPGGWNIIGQTPLKMFDANRQDAALLQPGQQVQFYSITIEEFNAIKAKQWVYV